MTSPQRIAKERKEKCGRRRQTTGSTRVTVKIRLAHEAANHLGERAIIGPSGRLIFESACSLDRFDLICGLLDVARTRSHSLSLCLKSHHHQLSPAIVQFACPHPHTSFAATAIKGKRPGAYYLNMTITASDNNNFVWHCATWPVAR